jgi:hypothetical protein
MSRACGVDGSSIFYDVDTIDLRSDPEKIKPASAFEAVFLGDVIDEISGTCFTVQENCKSLYPEVTSSNYTNWITSVDQENRMSLAHTIEKSNVPILYNTPRLCDPGITISRNWNLRNYIETRLYLFKFKYNFGQSIARRNATNCYPSVYFDFRPFNYILDLPNTPERIKKGEASNRYIHVSEWITVESTSGAEGYTPHMKLSSNKYKPPLKSSEDVFDDMVKKLIQTNFGASRKSVISEELYLGPNNKNKMKEFLGQFRKFIKEYDGAEFLNGANNNTNLPRVLCTDDVIRVLFYDLLHDGVVKKGDFDKFKKTFKNEFISFEEFQIDFWAGAKTTANSYGVYKSILKMNTKRQTIRQIPAICKTLGDLSQFMYASKYDTIVASGDKMGIATGLYVNARSGKKVKVMMEDVITGFIIYTGLPDINFVPKSTCTNSTNSGACKISGRANKNTVAEKIRASVPQNKRNIAKNIINKKPKGLKSMLNLISNAAKNQIPTNIPNTLKRLNSLKKYMDVDDLTQVAKILNVYKNKPGINRSTVNTIYQQIGNVSARLNTPNRANANANAMNTNNRTKLSNFMNKLNRLTENNKKNYLNQLNTSGSNLNKIKNAAYDTHRIRVFRTQLGNKIKNLSTNQLANYEQQIRNDRNQGVLQRVYNNARQAARRNGVTTRSAKRSRQGP